MSVSRARVRLFVVKEEASLPDDKGFEVLKHEFFSNHLVAGTPKQTPQPKAVSKFNLLSITPAEDEETPRLTDVQWHEENVSCIGWDGVEEDIQRILEEYPNDAVVEILADYCIDSYRSSSWDGDEWDQDDRLENEEHGQLSDKQIEWTIGPFKRNKHGLIEFIREEDSLNHSIQEDEDE